jgi:hypothetical protein
VKKMLFYLVTICVFAALSTAYAILSPYSQAITKRDVDREKVAACEASGRAALVHLDGSYAGCQLARKTKYDVSDSITGEQIFTRITRHPIAP